MKTAKSCGPSRVATALINLAARFYRFVESLSAISRRPTHDQIIFELAVRQTERSS